MFLKIKRTGRHPRRRTSGMTLIELLIGLAVSSIVMLAFLSLFATGQKIFINQEARSMALQDSHFPIRWLTRDISSAVSVLASHTKGGTTYTAGSTCLILQVPGIDANGIILDIETNFDVIIYKLNWEHGLWLERIIDAEDGISSRTDGSRVISDNIRILAFTYWGADDLECSPADAEVVSTTFRNVRRGVEGHVYRDRPIVRVRLRNRPLV